MATKAQIQANRLNSEKSTGPKTPEGKAKSCLNRTSHGFTSANLFIVHEDEQEFDALLADLTREFQPATPHQQILVERMAHNQWLSLRAIRLQSIVLYGSVPAGFIHKDLGILIRYQTAADRTYHKAHSELLKAQKERNNSEIGFESQNTVESPVDAQNALADPPPSPENLVPAEKIAPKTGIAPDFMPFEQHLAASLGITLEELRRAA